MTALKQNMHEKAKSLGKFVKQKQKIGKGKLDTFKHEAY